MMAGSDRPNPRKLSQAFMKGVDGLGSLRNRTALLAFFGQVGISCNNHNKISNDSGIIQNFRKITKNSSLHQFIGRIC